MERKVIVFKSSYFVDWKIVEGKNSYDYVPVSGTVNVMGQTVPKLAPAFALEYDIKTLDENDVVLAVENRRRVVDDFFNQVKTAKAVNQQAVQIKVGNRWITLASDKSEANRDYYVRTTDGALVPNNEALEQPEFVDGVLVNETTVNSLNEGYMTEYDFLPYLVMPSLSLLFTRSIMNRVNLTGE